MLNLKVMHTGPASDDHLLISGIESVRFEQSSGNHLAIATFTDGRVEEYVARGFVYVLNEDGKTIDTYYGCNSSG